MRAAHAAATQKPMTRCRKPALEAQDPPVATEEMARDPAGHLTIPSVEAGMRWQFHGRHQSSEPSIALPLGSPALAGPLETVF